MKLIKLEILNLASLDKPGGEVINFEEGALGSTSIFSIVGATGSGKSTLLDAICLALYNRAPRYPRKKYESNQGIVIYGTADETEKSRLTPTDGRNILTRGKKEGYSKLTFLANNGNLYRAEWHVYFQVKRFKGAQTSLYMIRQNNGAWTETECPWEDLPQIIGLDYDQFLRTVLIAQGSFANFLTAKENDRYELLEKLIGCEDLYSSIAAMIKEKREAAQQSYSIINAQVDSFKQYMLTDEALQELNEQIARLERDERLLNEKIKAAEKALDWYAAETKLQEEIKKQTDSVASAEQALEAIKGDIERLNLHDSLLPAVDILREIRRLERDISADKAQISRTTDEIARQKSDIEVQKKDLEDLEGKAKCALDAIDRAKPHIQKARELSTLISASLKNVEEKRVALDSAKREAEKADKALKQNDDEISKAQKQKSESEAAYQALKDAVDAQQRRLQADEEEAKSRLAAEQAKIEGISEEALSQAKDQASANLNDITSAIEIVGRIHDLTEYQRINGERQKTLEADCNDCHSKIKGLHVASLKAEVETLQRAHTLMTSQDWALHRSMLREGEPCPLCGSEHHPYAQHPDKAEETISEALTLLNEKRRALDTEERTEKELTSKIDKNNGELKGLRANFSKLTEEMVTQERKWTELVSRHSGWTKEKPALEMLKVDIEGAQQASGKAWREYRAVDASIKVLTKKKDAAVTARSDYDKQSQAQLRKAEAEISNANTSLERLKAQTANLRQQLQEKTVKQEAAVKAQLEAQLSLKELQRQFDAELGGKSPDAVEQQLGKAKADADRAVTGKKDKIAGRRADVSKSEGSLRTLNDKLKEAETSSQNKSQDLSRWIDAYNGCSERPVDQAVVATMLEATDDWQAIKYSKDLRQKALTSAQTLKAKAEKDMTEHLRSKPEKTAEELRQDREALEQTSRRQELQSATLQLQRHNDALVNMGDKAAELAQATADNDDWKAIYDSIGADGKTLRKIAQCYTLRFLVEHANTAIRKFNSRYELLQVKNSLGIRVIDHDRADDVRDTTSLSGGETFIVSLGLALGLSSLSSRNISFDNLFIDEGFGTLDPDTLATVIDSLAMLQTSQGKKVGVISHTDIMCERITTQIRVIKNGNSGSSHIEIYP